MFMAKTIFSFLSAPYSFGSLLLNAALCWVIIDCLLFAIRLVFVVSLFMEHLAAKNLTSKAARVKTNNKAVSVKTKIIS